MPRAGPVSTPAWEAITLNTKEILGEAQSILDAIADDSALAHKLRHLDDNKGTYAVKIEILPDDS